MLSPVYASNNVEATLEFVERTVRLVAFDIVAGVDGALDRRGVVLCVVGLDQRS